MTLFFGKIDHDDMRVLTQAVEDDLFPVAGDVESPHGGTRPDWIECRPGGHTNWRSALQRNLEKSGTVGSAAASDDPSAIRRPATRALDVNSFRDGLEFGAV